MLFLFKSNKIFFLIFFSLKSFCISSWTIFLLNIILTNVINLDPKWAEPWNKRATVFYIIGEYKKSQNDINKVLELEKRHFGALAGQGLVNIKLKNSL